MLRNIVRILTALVFILSGFVKAVDPVGFSFKLEEYFSPSVFNLPFLAEIALPLAVIIVLIELVLGFALLIGYRVKTTLALLIALCVFFAFLTFYSAYFQVVTDCGCFGDALKLTPWQSFWKDIVLLVLLIVLYLAYRNKETTKENSRNKLLVLSGVVLVTLFLSYKGIWSEPLIDFRDYKVGTDLNKEKERLQKEPSQYRTVYHLKNSRTGEEKVIPQEEYLLDQSLWMEGSPWVINQDATTQELVKQGYESEVAKLRIEDKNGVDLTPEILSAEHVVLLFSYAPSSLTNEEKLSAVEKVKGHPLVYAVSTDLEAFKGLNNTKMDATAIKTIARSNPFVLVLNQGKIVQKKPITEFQP